MWSLSLLYFAINIHARHWRKSRQEASREWHFRAALFHFLQSTGPTVPRRILLYCLLSLPLSMLRVFHQSCISARNPMMHHLLPLFHVNLNQLQSTRLDEDDFFFLFSDLSKDLFFFLFSPIPHTVYCIWHILTIGCVWWRLHLAEWFEQVLCRMHLSSKKDASFPIPFFPSHTTLIARNTSGFFRQAH